ncbi:MAG: hypothetical protein PHS54_00520 [Clostridia bacterium]|nr:hypothetical protein [Clostridia bacterium]
MKNPKDKNDFSSKNPKKKTARNKQKNISNSSIDSDEPIDENATRQAITELLQNSINKYANTVDNQLKETREDFECLPVIVSEFLENFIIIGHTLDGQRVVTRYTSTPAGLDGLTELCKKVLVRMVIQEQSGQ